MFFVGYRDAMTRWRGTFGPELTADLWIAYMGVHGERGAERTARNWLYPGRQTIALWRRGDLRCLGWAIC